MTEYKPNQKKYRECYEKLLDLTDTACKSSAESDTLWRLLNIFEYIHDDPLSSSNPLDRWGEWFTVENLADMERMADEHALDLEATPTADDLADGIE